MPISASSKGQRSDQAHRTPAWVILAGLYVLVLYPILRADRLYNDDLKRALLGRTGWDSNGRPLTTLLMKLLQCYDHALVDISPLTQILAIAVLVFAGTVVARRFCQGPPWLAALAVFPFGAQPFFLENLSYKFDALSMALALLAAVAPFAAPPTTRRIWWLGTFSLFACLNLYQPALGATLVFVVLESIVGVADRASLRSILRLLCARLAQLLLAALVYEGLVGIHVNGWVKQKSVPVDPNHLSQIVVNAAHFLHYVGDSFNSQWWLYFVPLLVVLGLVPAVLAVRYALPLRNTRGNGIVLLAALAGLLVPFLAGLAALGPLLLLADPPVAARVLIGTGALLAAGLIALVRTEALLSSFRLSALAGGMLAAGCCVIASAYGNALAAQKFFEDHVARSLADDIAASSSDLPLRGVLLSGAVGYAPETAHVVDEFPLMRSLIPPYIDAADQFHTHIYLLHFMAPFYDLRLDSTPAAMQQQSRLLAEACDAAPRSVRSAYRLYVIEHMVVVILGGTSSRRCIDDGN